MTEPRTESALSFRLMALWLRLREQFRNPKTRIEQEGITAGQTVLDYGCGMGSYTLPAARAVGEKGTVYALDINPLALNAVEKRARRLRLGNIRTIRSSRETGLEDESVDVILLYDVLHAVPNQAALLTELHRVLKNTGFLSLLPDHIEHDEVKDLLTGTGLFASDGRRGEVDRFVKCTASSQVTRA